MQFIHKIRFFIFLFWATKKKYKPQHFMRSVKQNFNIKKPHQVNASCLWMSWKSDQMKALESHGGTANTVQLKQIHLIEFSQGPRVCKPSHLRCQIKLSDFENKFDGGKKTSGLADISLTLASKQQERFHRTSTR